MCSISSAAKVSVWSTGIMYEFWKSVHLSGMERETSEWTFKSMSQEADWKFRIIGSCCLFVSKWWREINEGRTQEAYGKHEVESPYQSKTLRKVAVNSCTKMNPKTLEYNNTEAGAGICLAHLKGRMWDSSPHPSLNQYKNKNKKNLHNKWYFKFSGTWPACLTGMILRELRDLCTSGNKAAVSSSPNVCWRHDFMSCARVSLPSTWVHKRLMVKSSKMKRSRQNGYFVQTSSILIWFGIVITQKKCIYNRYEPVASFFTPLPTSLCLYTPSEKLNSTHMLHVHF